MPIRQRGSAPANHMPIGTADRAICGLLDPGAGLAGTCWTRLEKWGCTARALRRSDAGAVRQEGRAAMALKKRMFSQFAAAVFGLGWLVLADTAGTHSAEITP